MILSETYKGCRKEVHLRGREQSRLTGAYNPLECTRWSEYSRSEWPRNCSQSTTLTSCSLDLKHCRNYCNYQDLTMTCNLQHAGSWYTANGTALDSKSRADFTWSEMESPITWVLSACFPAAGTNLSSRNRRILALQIRAASVQDTRHRLHPKMQTSSWKLTWNAALDSFFNP